MRKSYNIINAAAFALKLGGGSTMLCVENRTCALAVAAGGCRLDPSGKMSETKSAHVDFGAR